MKRGLALILVLAMVFLLCACGMKKEAVSLEYGETYSVEAESLDDFDTLTWESADEAVATVKKGEITAVGPGSTTVSASNKEGKQVAEYTVTATVVPVTSIVLSTNACEIAEGESFQLSYTLFPENASDYGLNWKSADPNVATVSDGNISAVGVGQTTISISNTDGFIATCSVTVNKALPNFKELYGEWEGNSWFAVGDDGLWMKFDTNPHDYDSDSIYLFLSDYLAVDENLPNVLKDLGFKSSVYEQMNKTPAMMGVQKAENETAVVSWTYHPDHGLEVMIEVND